jgi:intein/homing endonuclease
MVRKHILDSLSAEEIENNVYLGILANESTLFNPLARIPPQYEDSPELYLLYLMRQPEYFYFFINKVLGYDMHPLHMSIFRDMWQRKFPMMVASRGFGKAELLDNLLLTPDGWMRMGDVKVGQKIYGRDGLQYDVTDIHPQGKKQVYRVTTLDGRFVDCCEDHLWVVKKQTKEKVLSVKEMYESGTKYVGPSGRHSYKYRIPNCEPIQYDEQDLPVDPYLMGYLIGNGTMNGSTPKFSTEDMFVVEEFKNRLEGFKIEQDLSNNNWTIVDENKEMIEVHAGNRHYFAKVGNRLTQIIKRLGLDKKCEEKFIPDIYKFSSVEQRMELIQGLVDSDGCVNESGSIEFTNTCEKVVNDISDVLRSLGISCQVGINDRSGQIMKMPQGTFMERTAYYRVYINTSKPVSKLPRKAERLKKSATSTEKYNSITSIEKLDKFEEMQCISVNSPDNTYITKDYMVTHNSFSLGMYALMRACMLPNRKIIITGAGFRQSKIIFDYIDNFWSKSPLLKSAYDLSIDGPSRGADLWQYKIGGSVISCVPLGDGSKIRGLRAQDLLCDEFGCLDGDSIVQTKNGFVRISDFESANNEYIATGDDNLQYEKPAKFIKTPLTDVYEVKFENGYVVKCSDRHQFMTPDGWKTPLELTEKDYVERSPSGNCKNFAKEQIEGLDEKMAWLMGFLVDSENSLGKFKEKDEMINFGFDGNKKIPSSILKSPERIVKSFFEGLLSDADCVNLQYHEPTSGYLLSYDTPSERFCRDVQILVYNMGFDGVVENINEEDKSIWRVSWSGATAKNLFDYFAGRKIDGERGDVKVKKAFSQVISVTKLDEKQHLYDYYLPKTNSFYAEGFRNHNSIPEDIYEQVLVGFAAVSSDPLNNVKKKAYEQFCERFKHQVKKLRVPTIDKFNKQTENNQLMISGTAYYEWNHFYKYFQRYRNILYTKGDKRKLEALFGGPVPKHFDWSNYAIYRVPFDLIPPGFMDEESVARSKLTVHSEIYGMEYDAVFSKDSNGFFKRSLIESCVVNEANKGKLPCKEIFKARLHGDKEKKYVYGIDPASERDNLAVIILEVHPDHWRVAHCWTTTRARYKKMVKHGLEKDQEFYAFVCRKIRDLDKRFPCHSIALDAQGGGYALLEALQSEAHLEVGEERLLEVIEHNKPKDSDAMYGRHIIHMIQFANAKWTAEANHNLKFDLESRRILFPYFDSVELELAFQEDQRKLKALNLQSEKDADLLIDSLEVCVEEIEQLKDELSNIVHSATAGGTERWDTPEVKTGGKSVGHMRKDRYSALVMANAVARTVNVYETHKLATSAPGGTLSQIGKSTGQAFSGNSPLAQMLNKRYSEMG